jgi:hypothetical protein
MSLPRLDPLLAEFEALSVIELAPLIARLPERQRLTVFLRYSGPSAVGTAG